MSGQSIALLIIITLVSFLVSMISDFIRYGMKDTPDIAIYTWAGNATLTFFIFFLIFILVPVS